MRFGRRVLFVVGGSFVGSLMAMGAVIWFHREELRFLDQRHLQNSIDGAFWKASWESIASFYEHQQYADAAREAEVGLRWANDKRAAGSLEADSRHAQLQGVLAKIYAALGRRTEARLIYQAAIKNFEGAIGARHWYVKAMKADLMAMDLSTTSVIAPVPAEDLFHILEHEEVDGTQR